jgi:hypothetical protein
LRLAILLGVIFVGILKAVINTSTRARVSRDCMARCISSRTVASILALTI